MRALNIDTLPKTNSHEFVDCGKLSLADDFRDSTVKKKLSKSNKPFKNYEDVNRCPFCKDTKYVTNLIIKEKK